MLIIPLTKVESEKKKNYSVRTTVLICHLITDLPCLHKGGEMPPAIVLRCHTVFYTLVKCTATERKLMCYREGR